MVQAARSSEYCFTPCSKMNVRRYPLFGTGPGELTLNRYSRDQIMSLTLLLRCCGESPGQSRHVHGKRHARSQGAMSRKIGTYRDLRIRLFTAHQALRRHSLVGRQCQLTDLEIPAACQSATGRLYGRPRSAPIHTGDRLHGVAN